MKGGSTVHDIEAKSILSPKNGMNLYRGCTHGCIYCDSRSECYGMTETFEDVGVKGNSRMKMPSLTLIYKLIRLDKMDPLILLNLFFV